MFRLTRKAGYGLMALKYLAEHSDNESLSARDIAKANHIRPQLLAKSLQRLAKVGIIRPHAGMSGGYSLLKSPRQISAFEVIYAIDGPLFTASRRTMGTEGKPAKSGMIMEPLTQLNDRICDLLRGIRLSDLVELPGGASHIAV